MDPVSLALSAFSFVASSLKPFKNQALSDGYAGFKSLIARRFGATQARVESTPSEPDGKVVGQLHAENGRVVVIGRDQAGTINMG